MKRWKVTALSVLLCAGMLWGCGTSYEADESTVFIRKDGSVVSTDVEAFDTDTYDEASLKSYVEDAISTYNEENGDDAVRFRSLKTKDGQATLTISYATAGDYQKFNGSELFTGSVAEALAAGYSFDEDFASVEKGEVRACDDIRAVLDESDYQVVIISGNEQLRVQVKGTIAYVTTAGTAYVSANTVSIGSGTSILGSDDVSDGTESASEVISTEEDTQAGEATDTVSDDDLLSETGEDSEVVFDFPEDDSETSGEVSQVYTYIIYK